MKNFFKNVWRFIKELFNKTQFDNKLFKKGITEVKKKLKEELKHIDAMNVNKLFDYFVKETFGKFGEIKVVRKALDKALEFAHAQLTSDECDMKCTLNKQIDKVAAKLIEYYDANF